MLNNYLCAKCKLMMEVIAKPDEEVKCHKCGGPMKKIFPNKFSFRINGKYTAKNSYGIR